MTFFGYAPIDNAITPTFTAGTRQIAYTVPNDVASQKDVLVSRKETTQDMAGDYNKVINMTFQHVLTAVQFKIGSRMAPGTIKKIEMKNIKNTGTYNFDTGAWSGQTGSVTYTIEPNFEIGTNRNVIFTGNIGAGSDKNDLLLLMPQTLSDDAEIDVTINDGGDDRILPISIGGTTEWKPGYTVTYSLSTSQEEGDYVLSVSADPNVGYQGETDKGITVESYKQSYYGTKVPVGWTCTYSIDGETDRNSAGEEITAFTNGVSNPTTFSTTSKISISKINPVSMVEKNTHTAALRAASEIGTEDSPYNLSNQTNGATTSIEYTSNCYVVSHPGYYCFPLVYGNAIKNSTTNAAAYTSNAAEPNTFVNHLGNQITDPYIETATGTTAKDAVIVWQDAYNLVMPKSVKIIEKDGKRFVMFQISKDYICQGNSVIAVRDNSGTIMWSWHIWVTDHDIKQTNKVVNHFGTTFQMIPYEVGFCDPDQLDYSKTKRNIVVTFTQKGNSYKSAQIVLKQSQPEAFTPEELTIRAPYYQFGRKDPICPYDGIGSKDMTQYNCTEQGYSFSRKSGPVSLEEGIKQPYTHFYNQDKDWNSYVSTITTSHGKYNLELWDAGNTYTDRVDESFKPVTKTVYDPSPVGFKMPPSTFFTGFTQSGIQEYGSSYFISNSPSSPDYKYEIYSLDSDGLTKLAVSFHALGVRDNNGERDTGKGECWIFSSVAVLWSGGFGTYMDIWPTSISPVHYESRAYGFAIRPIIDN